METSTAVCMAIESSVWIPDIQYSRYHDARTSSCGAGASARSWKE